MTKRDYAKADAFFDKARKPLLELLKESDKIQSKIYKNYLFALYMGYITFNLESYKETDKKISFEFMKDMRKTIEETKSYAETPNEKKIIDNIHADLLTEYFKKTFKDFYKNLDIQEFYTYLQKFIAYEMS